MRAKPNGVDRSAECQWGAANGRDEAAHQKQQFGSPADAGLDEDVIAMRSCCGFGDAERRSSLVETDAAHEVMQQARLCRSQIEAARHRGDLYRWRDVR